MLDGLKATLSGPLNPTTQHSKSLILSKTRMRKTTTSRLATSTLQGSLLVGTASARALLRSGAAVVTFTAGPVIASETWSAQTANQEGIHAHVHGHGCVHSAQPTHPVHRSSNAKVAKSCIARTGAHTSRAVRFAVGQGCVTTALKKRMIRDSVYCSVRSAGYVIAISAMTAYPAYRSAPVVVTATVIGVNGLMQRIHAKLARPPCAGIAHETGMIAGSA